MNYNKLKKAELIEALKKIEGIEEAYEATVQNLEAQISIQDATIKTLNDQLSKCAKTADNFAKDWERKDADLIENNHRESLLSMSLAKIIGEHEVEKAPALASYMINQLALAYYTHLANEEKIFFKARRNSNTLKNLLRKVYTANEY